MKLLTLSSLAAALLVSAAAFSQQEQATCTALGAAPACLKECPTTQKVTNLLVKWDEVAKQNATLAPEVQQAMASKMQSVAASCPIGSRMSDTMAVVKDALAFVANSQLACATNCPLEKADASVAAVAAGKELKAARTHIVASLNQLAGYTCGPCATECPSTAAKVATVAVAATADAQASCAAAQKNCPIRIATRLGEAKAAIALGKRELAALSADQRGQIMASFGEMAQSNPAVSLYPETIAALAEGLAGLEKLHGKMGEWASANAKLLEGMPAEAHMAFQVECALLSEASQLLASVNEAMGAGAPAGERVSSR